MPKRIFPSRVLLFYKKSLYKIYFLEKKSSLLNKRADFDPQTLTKLKQAHAAHYKVLAQIETELRRQEIPFYKCVRGRKVDFKKFDLVISVGGDGTFLEAARGITTQWIWGVNSDPDRSVGRLCSATDKSFFSTLRRLKEGELVYKEIPRLQVHLKRSNRKIYILNDLLVAHSNPAAMSRYRLKIGDVSEEQFSSGLWIATAAGSSGAVFSAGGKIFPVESPAVQYVPRELHLRRQHVALLRGGILSPFKGIFVESVMRNGRIYADGAHVSAAFHCGDAAEIRPADLKLKVIDFDNILDRKHKIL